MKRFDCSGSSGGGLGLRGIRLKKVCDFEPDYYDNHNQHDKRIFDRRQLSVGGRDVGCEHYNVFTGVNHRLSSIILSVFASDIKLIAADALLKILRPSDPTNACYWSLLKCSAV
jgi:hypothetical protein